MRIGFSDVDWAGSFYDRQSIYGFCIFAGGSLITWHSKKRNIVAHSSVKAKYQALAPTASEMLWFNLSFITWELMFLLLRICVVTIRLFQSLLIAIPCSMSILNNQP